MDVARAVHPGGAGVRIGERPDISSLAGKLGACTGPYSCRVPRSYVCRVGARPDGGATPGHGARERFLPTS